jgi:hypothetical protein
MRDFNGEVESRHRRLLSCPQFSMFGQLLIIGSDAKHRAFRFGVRKLFRKLRACTARLRQCSGSSSNKGIRSALKLLEPHAPRRRFGTVLTPNELKKTLTTA